MTTVLYGARAFDYIRAKEADIGTAATVIGVSKTAIAAFIAKENNSYVSTTFFAENISPSNIFGSRIQDRGLDLLATAKSYTMTDAQIRADASQVLLFRYQDQMTSAGGEHNGVRSCKAAKLH